MKNDIDIYEIAVERIRRTDCKVFLSVRMNDAHYTDDPAINSSFAVKEGFRHTIDRNGLNLDFSQKAVRNHYYSYIEELLQKYDVDGIETDWLRYPDVLPREKCADLNIISDFMKNVRNLIFEYNEDGFLAARILPTEQENLNKGFDACGWVADGSVDILTIENFYIPTNFELPVSEWKEIIGKRNANGNSFCLFCGSDWAVSCVQGYNIAMTPALVRGFSDTCSQSGADGVYLFNYFEENDTSSFEFVSDGDCGGFIRNCFYERLNAAKNFNALPRRYVHIGNTNQRYPIVLCRNECYEFFKTIKSHFKKCKVVIGVNSDIQISVYANDRYLGILNKEVVCKGFEYIPETAIGKDNHFIYALTQAAPVVFSVYLPNDIILNDNFCVKIQNHNCNEIKILWIEIVCE